MAAIWLVHEMDITQKQINICLLVILCSKECLIYIHYQCKTIAQIAYAEANMVDVRKDLQSNPHPQFYKNHLGSFIRQGIISSIGVIPITLL